jgi:MtN3 and saliva related transmembrane protein
MYELIGFLGVFLINLAYLPQLYKTIKTKKARDISVPFYILILLGIVAYLVYAVLIENVVYMVSNTVGLISPILMIYYGAKYGGE